MTLLLPAFRAGFTELFARRTAAAALDQALRRLPPGARLLREKPSQTGVQTKRDIVVPGPPLPMPGPAGSPCRWPRPARALLAQARRRWRPGQLRYAMPDFVVRLHAIPASRSLSGMQSFPFARAGLAAMALSLAVPAGAQDVEILGTLTGTVDGAAATWYVTAAEMQGETVSQSDFTGNPASGVTVSLFGHATKSVMSSAGSVLLSFSVNTPDAPNVSGVEITFGGFSKVNGETGFYSSDNDGRAEVSVSGFGAEGERLRISGTFSGTMPFQASGAPQPDKNHVVTVTDGGFDTLILPLSF